MDSIYCAKCGAASPPGNRFCSRCGAELAARPASRPEGRRREQVQQAKPATSRRRPEGRPSKARATGLASRAARWGQRVWDMITMGGCTALAGLWYWYSGMAETSPDLKTSATMVLLPLALIVFRKPIDRILAHVRPIREFIPPLVRLGIGLAIPLLVANYLYARGSSEFDFMFKTMLISTLASFVVLRNPTVPRTTALKGTRQ